MAAGVAGAVAWNLTAEDRVRAQLANFGHDVSSDRREAAASPRFKAENWTKAVTLLGRLTALETLNLSNTGVADIGPLKDFIALKNLNLSFARIANIEPLKSLTALQTLNLSNTMVVDIRPLKDLTALQTLDLSDTVVVDIRPLKGLTALRTLNLTDTGSGKSDHSATSPIFRPSIYPVQAYRILDRSRASPRSNLSIFPSLKLWTSGRSTG
jgi:Leucine-rich repeat (LRR) protein